MSGIRDLGVLPGSGVSSQIGGRSDSDVGRGLRSCLRGRRKRSLAVVALAVLSLSVGSMVVAPAPAQAAVKCFHATCNGKDPQAMGCGADAQTLDSFTARDGLYVELRQSLNCGAVWARGGLPTNASIIVLRTVAIVGYSCVAADTSCRKGAYYSPDIDTGQRKYTPMWSFQDYVRACKVNDGFETDLPSPFSACTNKH